MIQLCVSISASSKHSFISILQFSYVCLKLQTNISLLEGRRVVDTVTSDGHDGSLSLTALYNDQLLLWGGTCKHDLGVVIEDLVNLEWGHVSQVAAVDNTSLRLTVTYIVTVKTSCRLNIKKYLVDTAQTLTKMWNLTTKFQLESKLLQGYVESILSQFVWNSRANAWTHTNYTVENCLAYKPDNI